MIIVDGCKSDKEISNFANLEEVLTNLMDDEKMDDRVVTDVFVNNESFSEIYPHQAEDVSCDTITSVEVRSVPAAELAVDMSAEMGKVARMMGSGAQCCPPVPRSLGHRRPGAVPGSAGRDPRLHGHARRAARALSRRR